ncbi:conserved hypothetical protein [Pseudomonas veronii]|uniref:hypothetical protein n=1 Tax=Pseudomonas veronii TaxID=76761 RepID=UPI0017557222|nr:hypothetical protein [Pseudomonas veronii]CAD0266080.1 conserved hypothetical protein [Pseudomonas veronii]
MKRTPKDEAISALKVVPVPTLGMCVSTVSGLYLFATDSKWYGIAVTVAAIFTVLVGMATPSIIQEANKRAKARHRYPY